MKKILAIVVLLLLATGCLPLNVPVTPAATGTVAPTAAPSAEPSGEPEQTSQLPAEYAFSFTARTLDGEEVTEEAFGRYDLTMVNVWASWCGPCRSEMGELGELYGKLPENVGFLSVTVDDPGDLMEAKAILEQNGCAFPCLDGQASAGLMNGFLNKVMAIPTTIFFDRSGNQVGEWIVGVPQGKGAVSDAYFAEIQARLDLLKVK